ncbi:putative membrane protein [Luteibacter rhizovicinus]|uniref:Protoporphyrinogen IX oxidase n=1 Tax=Luteibacter rhizovicinus TaxID=242606 RepID=A0A4R3YUL9_9GAMM|nr:CopD family protein [Luteibacter rhizovicinus]TCV94903.1 putative membrane protein [Luteibacter rhizovicinus]
MAYQWIKSLHILFVMAWMAAAFYLPRILINLAEAGDEPAVRARLDLMGRRLYRFGHIMFGFALIFGLTLRLYFGIGGGWLHAKLTLVVILFISYILSGRMLKRYAAGGALPVVRTLRILNELPVFLLLAIIFLVIAKPF